MAQISKPVDINKIWASGGDILNPGDTKIATGWQVEIPPRQWFNYLDNKQDQAIAHINQHGIAVWDENTEYQSGNSYVQGSDGVIYKALSTTTDVNPVGDSTGSWQVAFATSDSLVKVATAAQTRAMTLNDVFISPLQLANAFTGAKQSLATNGFQILPGGLILNWGVGNANSSTSATVTFTQAYAASPFVVFGVDGGALSNRTVSVSGKTNTTANFTFSASANSFYWFALGV